MHQNQMYGKFLRSGKETNVFRLVTSEGNGKTAQVPQGMNPRPSNSIFLILSLDAYDTANSVQEALNI